MVKGRSNRRQNRLRRRPKKKFHSNRFTNQKLVEDVGGVLQDIVSMVVAHEAGIAERQSSSNFSGSNNIFDFVVNPCNETASNKKTCCKSIAFTS